jgi:hypothetical protein
MHHADAKAIGREPIYPAAKTVSRMPQFGYLAAVFAGVFIHRMDL